MVVFTSLCPRHDPRFAFRGNRDSIITCVRRVASSASWSLFAISDSPGAQRSVAQQYYFSMNESFYSGRSANDKFLFHPFSAGAARVQEASNALRKSSRDMRAWVRIVRRVEPLILRCDGIVSGV